MPALDASPLSVIIPTLDTAAALPATLTALMEGSEQGLIREVLVADGGSRDATVALAERYGAQVVAAPRGRGAQLAAGGAAAAGGWLLFLHADTRLAPGWAAAVANFIGGAGNDAHAGYLRFRLDDASAAARRVEAVVAWRCQVLALPYGDQGLLIAAPLYRAIGGFRPLPLMEDVDFIRRLGRRRLVALEVDAVTSAARYRQGGYVRRPLRNLGCLTLYFLGLPPHMLVRLYG
jgi:rSAM/selenodomain-associated transferase 2